MYQLAGESCFPSWPTRGLCQFCMTQLNSPDPEADDDQMKMCFIPKTIASGWGDLGSDVALQKVRSHHVFDVRSE